MFCVWQIRFWIVRDSIRQFQHRYVKASFPFLFKNKHCLAVMWHVLDWGTKIIETFNREVSVGDINM